MRNHQISEEEQQQRKEELAGWRREAAMELDAMGKCFDLLCELSKDSQGRVINWLRARLDNRPYYDEPPF